MKFKFFNEELKERFLLQQEDLGTRRNMAYRLQEVSKYESEYEKDVCNLNFEELEGLYYALGFSSRSVAEVYNSIISSYIDYAIENGYSDTNINYTKGITDIIKYISRTKEEGMYLTKEEIYKMAGFCSNPQDGLLLVGFFEGISTQNSYEEFVNLKKDDLDEKTKMLHLCTGRSIKMSNDFVSLFNEVKNTNYIEIESKRGKIWRRELASTNNILRPVVNKRTQGETTKNLVSQRFQQLKNDFGKDIITPSSIETSGKIYLAKEIKERDGITTLSLNHCREINNRFGYDEKYDRKLQRELERLI